MKVDIVQSSNGEVGIVTNRLINIQSTIVALDYISGQISLKSDTETLPFNILLSSPLSNHIKDQVHEVYWGVIQDGEIAQAHKLPIHVNGRFNTNQVDRKFYKDPAKNFEKFLKDCNEGQPLHRESFDDDPNKLKSVFEGVSPSLLKASANIQQVIDHAQKYEYAPQHAPVFTPPAPAFGPPGSTPAPTRAKPSHVTTGSDLRNPMTYFVKKRHKNSFLDQEVPEQGEEEPQNLDEILAPIMSLTGLETVKKQVLDLAYVIQSKKIREEAGLQPHKMPMHMIFSGSPGTGKTTVAREIGQILAKLGYLDSGHVVEVQRFDLVSKWSGETEQKARDVFMSALDGILFIDEAYSLTHDDDSNVPTGKEALTAILKLMEDYRERVIVIAAGYTVEMQKFLDSNPGLRSRFGYTINFPNYKPEELLQIFELTCSENGYTLDTDAIEDLRSFFSRMTTSDQLNGFGNARGVRNLFDKALIRQAARIVSTQVNDHQDVRTIIYDDIFPDESLQRQISKAELEELLKPLNDLIGMDDVKRQISDFIYMMHMQIVRRQKKLPTNPIVLHSIFSGPPGTGKTTVARILGRILNRLGYLRQGHVVETDKSGLIGKWAGHTPEVVKNKFSEAEGGILFIDEAYALNEQHGGANYGKEAIDTILKIMEDRSSGTMVICAGYPEEMKDFLKSNPGLTSRFPFHLNFKTYKVDELIAIFEKMCLKQKYQPTSEAVHKLEIFLEGFSNEELDKHGNARLIRNIFERTIVNQSRRLNANLNEEEDILTLVEEDLYLPEFQGKKIGFV